MIQKEYKFLGLNMESISIVYGIFLILWGFTINFVTSSSSFTSLIPSFFGFFILLFSILALIFSSKKKLLMHIVVLLGLLIALGGLDIFRSLISGSFFNMFWADLSKLMMLLTGIFFLIQCIRSFIHARKLRDLKN